MAPPLAQSSPPGKEKQGRRESERKERFFLTGIVIPLLEEEGLLRARRHSVPE
jgi:hypothetical protein